MKKIKILVFFTLLFLSFQLMNSAAWPISSNGDVYLPGYSDTGYYLLHADSNKWEFVDTDTKIARIQEGLDGYFYMFGLTKNYSTPGIIYFDSHHTVFDAEGTVISNDIEFITVSTVNYTAKLYIDSNGDYLPDNRLDSDNNIHAIFSKESSNFSWMKLSINGTILNHRLLTDIVPMESSEYLRMILDSDDNIHMIWMNGDTYSSETSFGYLKLDNNGSILKHLERISSDCGPWDKQLWSVALDNEDNFHIIYHPDNYSTGGRKFLNYMKLDSTGNILIGPTTILTDIWISGIGIGVNPENDLIVVLSPNDDLLYMKLDSEGNILEGPIDVIKASNRDNTVLFLEIGIVIIFSLVIFGYAGHIRKKKMKSQTAPSKWVGEAEETSQERKGES